MRGVFPRDEHFMRIALREAAQALEHGDVPVGCVVVRDGQVVGEAHNERELRGDPTAHAEIRAARGGPAGRGLAAAGHGGLLHPRALPDVRGRHPAGARRAAGLRRPRPEGRRRRDGRRPDPLPRLLHRVEVQGGVLAADALSLLRSFFDDRR